MPYLWDTLCLGVFELFCCWASSQSCVDTLAIDTLQMWCVCVYVLVHVFPSYVHVWCAYVFGTRVCDCTMGCPDLRCVGTWVLVPIMGHTVHTNRTYTLCVFCMCSRSSLICVHMCINVHTYLKCITQYFACWQRYVRTYVHMCILMYILYVLYVYKYTRTYVHMYISIHTYIHIRIYIRYIQG